MIKNNLVAKQALHVHKYVFRCASHVACNLQRVTK